MSKDNTDNINTEEENIQGTESQDTENTAVEDEGKEEVVEKEKEVDEVEVLKAEVEELKDKHLRLYSEFENYRRRTIKEKQELIKTATENLMVELIPVIDDFERAKNLPEETSNEALLEGYELIYQKLSRTLKNKGLDAMKDKKGSKFDAELHEAISQIPAPKDKLKGKIVDVVEKGYTLNDKVVRFAKVVIGS